MATTIENLTNPGQNPVDGDSIRITLPSGATITKLYWTPLPDEPMPVVNRVTKLAFLELFTPSEFTDILTAAKTNVEVEMWVKKLDAVTPDPDGTSIDLADPRTILGVQQLESAGLIAVGRAAEILA